MIQKNEVPSFEGLGIATNILAILKQNNFIKPTPIQHQVIPVANQAKDVVGIAQTGTGKTLAFGVPLIQCVLATRKAGLVLLPTRELALQVNEVLEKIGRPLGVKTAVLIGGASAWKQKIRLQNKPDIVIATPGRLADHLKQGTYSLNKTKVVVLDEADRMLDIGFLPEINRILNVCPKERQTMLFSATMPNEIAKIAAGHMKMPLRIEVAPQGTSSENIEQEVFIVGRDNKMRLLDKILTENAGSVLIFSRTKHGAKKITRSVIDMGHRATEIHSNRSLSQRIMAIDGFKSGKFRVLVATDIAARGIDVSNISLVINFDLPDCSEDYVHRIGRTGRAGKTGKAISFATPDQKYDIKQIERLIRKTLPIISLPVLPPARAEQTMSVNRNSNRFNYPPRSGSNNFGRSQGNNRGRFDRNRSSGERNNRFEGGRMESGKTEEARTETRTRDNRTSRGGYGGRNNNFTRTRNSEKPFGRTQGRKNRDDVSDKPVYQDDYSRWKQAYNATVSDDRYPDKRNFGRNNSQRPGRKNRTNRMGQSRQMNYNGR